MSKKKGAPLWGLALLALPIVGFSSKYKKEHLADQTDKDILNQEIFKEARENYNNSEVKNAIDNINKANAELDNTVDRLIDAKIAELENSNIIEETRQDITNNNQGTQDAIPNTTPDNNGYFKTYNFSEDTKYMMVKLAAAEQGSGNLKGMAVEMAIMLNLLEKMGGNFRGLTGEAAFRAFISADPFNGGGGWFAHAPEIAESEAGLSGNLVPRGESNTEEAMKIAEETLKGFRCVQPYILNHVSSRSIAYIETAGVRYDKLSEIEDINNYKPDETIVMTKKYGPYIYAGHFAGTTDPMGYTEEEKEGKLNVYYDFDTGKLVLDGVMVEKNSNNNSQKPKVDFDYDNKVAVVNNEEVYVFDDTEKGYTTTTVSLTDDMKYAKESQIHSDSAILYTNTNSNKNNITICVNAGHGTSGGESVTTNCHPDGSPKVTGGSTAEGSTTASAVASGMTFINGTEEREATLRMALKLKDVLLSEGYNVLMIREKDDVQLDNIARTVLANAYADCHISLHWDSTTSDKGAYYMKVPDVDSYKSMEPVASTWEKSDALGERLIEGLRNKGIKIYEDGSLEMDLTQTSYSSIPSIDIELGDRLSNTSDEKLAVLAEGLLEGITQYFENSITLPNHGEASNSANVIDR